MSKKDHAAEFRGRKLTEDEFQRLPFYVLGAVNRFQIVNKLKEKGPQTLIKLAKMLDARSENIHGAKDFLVKCGWIEEKNKKLFLTPLANHICNLILPSVNFANKHEKYFSEHDFGDMPEHFKQGVGVFEGCEFIENNVSIRLKEDDILENSEKYSYNILSAGDYSDKRVEKLIEKFKTCKPFALRTILKKNAIKPKKAKSLRESIDNAIREVGGGTRELRIQDNVMIQVVMNYKEAIVIFPKLNGEEPDMNYAFYSKDESFLQWCFDYFEYCWNKATPHSSYMD